jgi:hypothetical protein
MCGITISTVRVLRRACRLRQHHDFCPQLLPQRKTSFQRAVNFLNEPSNFSSEWGVKIIFLGRVNSSASARISIDGRLTPVSTYPLLSLSPGRRVGAGGSMVSLEV